jgi:hypothetical protein
MQHCWFTPDAEGDADGHKRLGPVSVCFSVKTPRRLDIKTFIPDTTPQTVYVHLGEEEERYQCTAKPMRT